MSYQAQERQSSPEFLLCLYNHVTFICCLSHAMHSLPKLVSRSPCSGFLFDRDSRCFAYFVIPSFPGICTPFPPFVHVVPTLHPVIHFLEPCVMYSSQTLPRHLSCAALVSPHLRSRSPGSFVKLCGSAFVPYAVHCSCWASPLLFFFPSSCCPSLLNCCHSLSLVFSFILVCCATSSCIAFDKVFRSLK